MPKAHIRFRAALERYERAHEAVQASMVRDGQRNITVKSWILTYPTDHYLCNRRFSIFRAYKPKSE